ncbi:LOB domain-containing protein 4-like [Vigna umbellata]|uniref:LOB domain-containing protein 4-like n=1 Tax=Vigna umbellata TaxID=87088 RepID=UPI001F5FB795|nr:LOB domain-containing protein 4-like [Vigna umbellata]XP_047155389.1 LOB domain-containing protein 4-like [Vigna umbellata]
MSSLNSPCAACKLLRRKCTQECVFAPYFPPDNPQRFECVHRVFGASNVSKLLNELSVAQRDDAVKSLAYEAEARLRDPVYGCVGIISLLQQRLRQIQMELQSAKKELSTYVSPQTMQILLANPGMVPSADIVVPPSHQPLFNHVGNNMAPQQILVGHGGGQTMVRDPQQQDFQEAQQIALATREQQQQMFRNYEQKVFGGFEPSNGGFGTQGELLSPLALGNFGNVGAYQMQQLGEQHLIESQLLLSPQQGQPHQQQQCESEDTKNVLDFSVK